MKTRRLWGLLLTALLAFGLCPALAFADEAQPAAGEAGAATAADDATGDAGKDEGDKDGANVALMFNVYENPANVEKIADILEEYGFKCTFFVGGSWVAKNPNALLKVASKGFEIGNHGYLHRDHAKLTLKQNMEEIVLTERLIDSVLGDLPDYKNSKLLAGVKHSVA